MGLVAFYDESEMAFMSALKERLAIDREGTLQELATFHLLKATFIGSRILPEDDSRDVRPGALR
jgi:hypothetical protein